MLSSDTHKFSTPKIAAKSISRSFGSVVALEDVSIEAHGGSIHAVTGENGAGKSTLMKILAGVVSPSQGQVELAGAAVRLRSPRDARRLGVSTVFQEFTLLPNLSIAENLALGREPGFGPFLSRRAMEDAARAVLKRIGFEHDPRILVGRLSVGEQQMVEIAKGLIADASVFIFDEPTAALNKTEADKLEQILLTLKAEGKAILYISHRLDEIFRLCDTISVLKDGRMVTTRPARSLDEAGLVNLMVGRPVSLLYPPRRPVGDGPARLRCDDVRVEANSPTAKLVVTQGEIVGLAGLEGQGQRELLRALAGVAAPYRSSIIKTSPTGDEVEMQPSKGVVACQRDGLGFVPGDRKGEGLYLDLSIGDNIALGMMQSRSLFAPAFADASRITALSRELGVKCHGVEQICGTLSGGNQQKVLLGRLLAAGMDTLLIEEPTRGVDVGARSEIYGLLRKFVDDGGAILLTSSDLNELLGLCDRILVVRDGRIVGELSADEATEEKLMTLALTGNKRQLEADVDEGVI